MALDPFGDGVEHLRVAVLRPFGVQPDNTVCAQLCAALAEGLYIFCDCFGTIDDELKLIGAGDVLGKWQLPALGAECDPVQCAAYWKGTASLEVGLLAYRVKCVSERAEIVNGGLAAGDNGELGLGLSDLGGEGCGFEPMNVLRDVVRVPGASGVTPRAMHGAAEGADEVGGPSCMRTFALEGVELFVDREHVWRLEAEG